MVQTREKKNEYQRQYRQNNKEKIAESTKEYNRIYHQEHKEERAVYREVNKEKIKDQASARNKAYREVNKEKIKEYTEANKEKRAELLKIYNQTPAGKKLRMMSKWRSRGVINVTEKMYNDYIATTHCECCLKEFSSSRDRCLDHNHETGEYRQILCQSCNNQDYWKKVIG